MVHMRVRLEQGIISLRKQILKDVHTTDYGSDPFGYCNYLFFLLKNNLENKNLDNLVDWMNSYIREVVINKKISKSADSEITVALFGYYILNKFERLTLSLTAKEIEDVLNPHLEDDGTLFKRNFSYTLAVTLSLLPMKTSLSSWSKMRKAIDEAYSDRKLLCDPKNLVYYNLLLEEEDKKKELSELAKYVAQIIGANGIKTYDKPYYLWVAWKNKKFLKKELVVIKTKIANSIENFLDNLEVSDEPQSKIIKSLFFDMALGFSNRAVLVSYDEYHEPNMFAKIGGFLIGILLISTGVILIYGSIKFGFLKYANVTLISTKNFHLFFTDSLKLLGALSSLLLETYMLLMGYNIILEVAVKNIYQKCEINPLLWDRTKTFLKWSLLIMVGQLLITPLL